MSRRARLTAASFWQDENGEIPADGLRIALEHKQAIPFLPEAWGEFLQSNVPNVPSPWTSIGPGNIGGRIRSLIIHPINPNIMWVGGLAGGVWKTTNGGTSWSTNTDELANLAVNCMAIDSANPDILYAGTGEGFFNDDSIRGDGIFKTEDGGTNWRRLERSRFCPWVNRLAISPTNSQIILAATQFGLYRSTEGGENWSPQLGLLGVLDVRFKPDNTTSVPDIPGINCLAGTRTNGAYYSWNSGETWTAATGLPASPGRVELAYSRSNPAIVYASIEANGGQLYRSTDGGYSFFSTGPGPIGAAEGVESSFYNNAEWEKDDPTDAPSGSTSASWYNNSLWVDPINPNRLLAAGARLWRTTQGGGGGWVEGNNIHADHHVFAEHPAYDGVSNRIVFGGNDGGIYKTSDVLAPFLTWTSLNHTLGITQFYGAAGQVASGTIIGGTQDNGTIRYQGDPENWSTTWGGDGGYCAVDQTANPYFYGEYIRLQIFRSVDGGASIQCIDAGIGDAPSTHDFAQRTGGNADFIAPFVLDPNNPARILAGGGSLWRSDNVRADNPAEVLWRAIKEPVANAGNISSIAVAPGNSNIIWVGYNNGSVYFTENGTVDNPTWIKRDSGLPSRRCTRITIANAPQTNDPQVATSIYATFAGFKANNVWKTQNNGGTWAPIHHNLPGVPVRSLVISQSDPSRLYVGTEVGVFASANADTGAMWSPSNGDPNAPVFELFWMGPKLVSATHGRGIFTIIPPNP
jgi:photosystem II stability/assembly factor-like uncharacterized protein